MVYNITVANNHSYIAGDFIVSNCHGKIYRLEYLRENNIRFPNEFRLNEDSYFNLVAVNCAKRPGKIDECTYIWRDNQNSLTRDNKESNFFFRANPTYIIGQIWGLKKIYEINGKITMELLGMTLYNIYKSMMIQLYYKYDDYSYLNDLESLKDFKASPRFFCDEKVGFLFLLIVLFLKPLQIIEGYKIIFFKANRDRLGFTIYTSRE